jgi:TrmH family RNA methyltransferase
VREPVSESIDRLLSSALSTGRIGEEQVFFVSETVFEKLSEEKAPEGILSVAHMPRALHRQSSEEEAAETLERSCRLLLLEAVRDPGNLGTVIRSAAALGIDTLVLSSTSADLYHPRTVRSAMGALFRLPTVTVAEESFPTLIHRLRGKGRRVFAAALTDEALSLGSFPMVEGDCFVIGNEGHGLSKEVIEACDRAVVIPMVVGNESLNAAAAAAICIWETVRAGSPEGRRG